MTPRLVAALFIAVAGAALLGPARAASTGGALDPSFGRGGRVVSAINLIGVGDAAVQADGKIVVAATVDNAPGANDQFGIVRYLASGALDANFGNRGIAFGAPISQYNFARAIVVQADRKIVVVGDTIDPRTAPRPTIGVGLARYNPNGTLDRTFGRGGLVTVAYPGASGSHSGVLIVQRDGKIVIGGSAVFGQNLRFAATVERLNQNGSVDTSFGTAGAFEDPNLSSFINGLALETDGTILALTGTSVVHLSSNGAPLPIGPNAVIAAAAHTGPGTFLPNGQFALAETQNEFNSRFDLDVLPIRFNGDGTVDTTFLSSAVDFSGEGPDALQSNPRAIALQADGSLLVGGSENSGCCSSVFGLARITSAGPLDPTFGSGGGVTTTFNGTDSIDSLIVQRDGKIVAVGHTTAGTLMEVAIARYLGS